MELITLLLCLILTKRRQIDRAIRIITHQLEDKAFSILRSETISTCMSLRCNTVYPSSYCGMELSPHAGRLYAVRLFRNGPAVRMFAKIHILFCHFE